MFGFLVLRARDLPGGGVQLMYIYEGQVRAIHADDLKQARAALAGALAILRGVPEWAPEPESTRRQAVA